MEFGHPINKRRFGKGALTYQLFAITKRANKLSLDYLNYLTCSRWTSPSRTTLFKSSTFSILIDSK